MARSLCISSYLTISILLGLVVFCEGCSKDSDCDDGLYCCLSHCTSREIRCSEMCSNDQDCKRNELCHQNYMCVQCSGRFSCGLKSCYNDTDCPSDFKCGENHMCGKNEVPKRHTFSLLPFIIIIGVLGFALIILCYTEGCWKELFVYVKRHWGRYGTIALDEVEADRREGTENESAQHSHTNKSCVNNRENARSSTISSTSSSLRPTSTHLSNSPQSLRNTHVISQHSRTLVMAISQATRNQTRNFHSNSICNAINGNPSERADSGSQPLLASSPSDNVNSSEESPPTYLSLFDEEFEEPPPKYEDVVHVVQIPVNIEMRTVVAHGSNRSLRSQDINEIETMV